MVGRRPSRPAGGGAPFSVRAAFDPAKHPHRPKGKAGGQWAPKSGLPAPGTGTVLYRSIPAPLGGPSQFRDEGDPGWDDAAAQVEANMEDWDGLGHYWGTEKTATHYGSEGSITFGVEWPKDVGGEEQNGTLIPPGVAGRLVSVTVHTAKGPVPLKVPNDYPVYASKR